jgi:RecB family exonuclease
MSEMDAALKAGKRTMGHFFEWWRTEPRTVVANEKGFKLAVDNADGNDIVVSGRFDRVERTTNGLRIIDFKTGEPRTQAECDTDLQLSIYALASAEIWPEPVSELSLLFLNERGINEVKTTRSPLQLENAKDVIRSLCRRMESEDYTPDPSVPKCTNCPYKDICPASMAQ